MKWLKRLFRKKESDIFLDKFAPGFEINPNEFKKLEQKLEPEEDSEQWHPHICKGKVWYWTRQTSTGVYVESGTEIGRNKLGDVTLSIGVMSIQKKLQELRSKTEVEKELGRVETIHSATMLRMQN